MSVLQQVEILEKGLDILERIANEEGGSWITTRGTHIFIPDGADKGEVVKAYFDKMEEREKSMTPAQKQERKDKQEQYKIMEDNEKEKENPAKYNDHGGKVRVSVADEYFKKKGIDTTNIKLAWNDFDSDFTKNVKSLHVGQAPDKFPDRLGQFTGKVNSIGIFPKDSMTEQRAKEIITHEIAHSNYFESSQDVKDQWKKETSVIGPVSNYVQKFNNEFMELQLKLAPAQEKNDTTHKELQNALNEYDKTGINKIKPARIANDKALNKLDKIKTEMRVTLNSIANETHSEFVVINRNPDTKTHQYNKESYDELVPIYKKIFGDKK